MARQLTDDQIKWILSLDAKGVQSELVEISSKTKQLEADNKRLQAEMKEANKQMREAEKQMQRMAAAGKADSDEYRQLEKTLESVNHDVADYSRRLRENNRAIEENKRMTDQMVRTLRIEDMTMSQLKKRAKELEKQLEHTAESTSPEAYRKLDDELTAVRNRMGELRTGSKQATSVFKGGLMVLGGNLMTKAIGFMGNLVAKGKEWVKVGIDMAKGAEGVVSAFNKLDNSKKHLQDMRDSTRNTISDLKLMEKAVRADELGVGVGNMATLMQFAQVQAKKLKKDVDYMADSIVDGIGRKSTMILDNLGISALQVQQEVKKTGDFNVAVMNIVTAKLKEQGEEALTGAEKATKSATKWENAQLKVGQKAKWLGELWDEISGNMADNISDLVGETRTATEVYDDQIETIADLEVNAKSLAERYDELKAKTTLSNDEQAEMSRIMNSLSQTVPGIVTEFDKYGNVLSINTQKVYDYIEAEKARLQFIHGDAIEDLEKQIKFNKALYQSVEKEVLSGRTAYRVMTGDRTSTTQYRDMNDKEKAEKQKELQDLGKKILGAEQELSRLSGTAVEEQVIAQKNLIKARQRFNAMNKVELDSWIKDEKNAKDEYLDLAKQIYSQKSVSSDDNGKQTKEQQQRKELQTELNNLENNHKKELQLLEDTRLKEKKTDEEHKIAVAKSDKKHYDERVKLLQDFRKKVTDKKFQSDIDTQIVDSTGKSKAQDAVIDKANIDAATKNRDELLKVEQIGTNVLKRVQAERDELAQVSALRQQTIELSSAQRKLEILRQYSKDVQDLDIADAALKEKLVRDANDAVIQAETEAIQKRKALDNLYKNTNNAVRSQYGNIPISEQIANEKAIIDALYNEKLISEEAHQQAIVAIEQKYADLKLQVKQQYGIESTQELYQQELELLQQKLDQELLTQKEFEEAKKQLQIEYATQAAQKINQVVQAAANAGNAIQQAATANLEAQYQERIAAAEGNAAEQERLEEELAEKKLELEKKFADVQFAIKAAEIISSTAVAIMVAYKQLGPIAGSIAGVMLGITGAAQLVAANAERKKVKALTLKGSSSKSSGGGSSSGNISLRKRYAEGGYNDPGIVGGYTGDGGRYEAAGVFPNGSVFDRGEYIVPQPVLKRPSSIPYIKALEAMRKPYSTANPLPKRFAEGGFNSYDEEPTRMNGGLSPELFERLTTVLEDLNDNGVRSNIGISELQAELDQYNKEKERFSLKK